MTADVIDFNAYLRKKQMEETKEWLKNQGVMPIPCTLPSEFFEEDDKPSDSE